MGVKAWKSVLKEFFPVVDSEFGFLVDEYGFAGPRHVDGANPNVSFMTAGFGYEVLLESGESTVSTTAWVAYGDGYLSAGLASIVEVSGLAANQKVLRSASSVAILKKSVVSQSGWLRKVHRRLVEDSGGVELMRRAHVRDGGAAI